MSDAVKEARAELVSTIQALHLILDTGVRTVGAHYTHAASATREFLPLAQEAAWRDVTRALRAYIVECEKLEAEMKAAGLMAIGIPR